MPSRWLNRLEQPAGRPARAERPGGAGRRCRRGRRGWLAQAAALDLPEAAVPPRAAPLAAAAASRRGRSALSVTAGRAAAARSLLRSMPRVLRLRPLDPLAPEPDAPTRGNGAPRGAGAVRHATAGGAAGRRRGPACCADDAGGAGQRRRRGPRRARSGGAAASARRRVPRRRGGAAGARRAGGAGGRGAAGGAGAGAALHADGAGRPDRPAADGRIRDLRLQDRHRRRRPKQQAFAKQLLLEAAMAEARRLRGRWPAGPGAVYVGC